MTDIRFFGPRNDDTMSGHFEGNDWDSDIEDSNSSEEFTYAKGASQIGEYLRSTQNEMCSRNQNNDEIDETEKSIECNQDLGDDHQNTKDIWNCHEDLIAVTTKSIHILKNITRNPLNTYVNSTFSLPV